MKFGKLKELKRKKEPFNSLVIDCEKGFGPELVKEPKGRRWLYGKDWVYLMMRRNDTLTAIELPPRLGKVLPDKLYRALFWKEADILFSLQNTLLEKLNLFGVYILIAVLLFFIFLVFSSL